MIENILRIHNVGKFLHYDAPADLNFGRLTVIYGGNGQGKTTLAAIFRSLAAGDPMHIQARQSLGHIGVPSVSMRLARGNAEFQNSAWSATFPKLEVFDTVFVAENVYCGDAVEYEQRQNLYRFAIGHNEVKLARAIAGIQDQSRELTGKVKRIIGDIGKHIVGVIGIDAFVALEPVPGIELKLEETRAEIAALEEAGAIAAQSLPETLSLPELWFSRIEGLLSAGVDDVSQSAEERVKRHLADLDALGENWIGQGMGYVRDDRCPFCRQPAGDLLSAYRSYFSKAYGQHKQRIARALEFLENSLAPRNLWELQKKLDRNRSLSGFWGKYVPCEFSGDVGDIPELWENLRRLLGEHLQKKTAAPLEKIVPDERLTEAMASYQALCSRIEEYNRFVESAGRAIAEKKRQTGLGNLASARQRLEFLENTARRYLPQVEVLCREYRESQQAKSELDEEKSRLKQRLNDFTWSEIPKYQKLIDDYLVEANADFRMVKAKESHIGGKPSLSYQLAINNVAVDLKASPRTPCFNNTLSSGDKSTLAFALFVARLYQSADLSEKIVIFDDPISDLDPRRTECVKRHVLRIADLARQVILLSHNPYFLKSVLSARPDARSLCLVEAPSGNTIAGWDLT